MEIHNEAQTTHRNTGHIQTSTGMPDTETQKQTQR